VGAARVQLHQLAGNTLDGFAPFTEAPLAYPDGLPRIEQRFVVC
jgi:hypothetical protein